MSRPAIVALIVLSTCALAESPPRTKTDAFTMQGIRHLIASSELHSVGDLLGRLPRDVFSNYALVKSARGIQEGSPSSPRVILFRKDGDFALTFNGQPGQRGYDSVEIMEYSGETGTFRFFDLQFSPTAPPRISEPNPIECLKCHSSEPKPNGVPKPIWPGYERWYGAFGEEDDHIGVESDPTIRAVRDDVRRKFPGSFMTTAEIEKERDEFLDFLKSASSNRRYRHLQRGSRPQSRVFPYQEDGRALSMMPNLRLAALLDANNAKQIAQIILKSDAFAQRPYAFLAWAYCAAEVASLNPLGAPIHTRLHFYEHFGVPKDLWNLRFGAGTPAIPQSEWYISGLTTTTDFVDARMFEQVMQTDETLRGFYKPSWLGQTQSSQRAVEDEVLRYLDAKGAAAVALGPSELPRLCQYLKGKVGGSAATEKRAAAAPPPAGDVDGASLIHMVCERCHSKASPGKQFVPIDFAAIQTMQPETRSELMRKIRARLESNDPRFQMPPDRYLNAIEKASILDYLGNQR